MNSETIALIANLSLTLSFIVALIFGIGQVRAASRDRRERLTLETLRNFQSREFADLVMYISNTKTPQTFKEMRALPLSDQAMWMQYGQEMESLGMLVAEKLINIDLVDKTLGSLVITTWEKFLPLFTDIRENQPDPFLGEYFQWLAAQLDYRMKNRPREPFYKNTTPIR